MAANICAEIAISDLPNIIMEVLAGGGAIFWLKIVLAIVMFGAGIFSLISSRSFLGILALITCTCWGAWQVCFALMESSPEAQSAVWWTRLSHAFICIILVVIFQLLETSIYHHEKRHRLILIQWSICALVAPLILFTPLGITHAEHYWWGYVGQWGPLGYFLGLWMAVSIIFVSWDQWQSYQQLPRSSIERNRRRLVAAMSSIAFLGPLDFFAYMGFNFYQAGSAIALAFTGMILFISRKSGWSDVGPQMASKLLAEKARTAILVVDADGLIRFANNKSKALFHRSTSLDFREIQQAVDPELTIKKVAQLAKPQNSRPFRIELDSAEGEVTHLDTHVSKIEEQQGNHAWFLEFQDVSQELSYQQSLLIRDATDPLTKLPTRSAFVTIARNYNEAGLEQDAYCILAVGIAGLRNINERHGYEFGDGLICNTANWLRERFPSAPVIARIGGDEFALLLPGAEFIGDANLAEKRLAEICNLGNQENAELPYNLYGGMAVVAQIEDGLGAALRNATFAMISARNESSLFKFYAAKDRAEKVKTEQLYEALEVAVERGEFELHYQPIIDIKSNLISGFEALIRWKRPDHGLLPPGMFIELIENSALGQPVQDWIIRNAAEQLQHWQVIADRPIWLSVNITQDNIRDSELLKKLNSACESRHLDKQYFCIEVTERMAMGPDNEQALVEIGDEGYGIAVDDFGTGYSALSRLAFLPISKLKIDRNFVSNMANGASAQTLVRSIASLGLELQMDVVAEGVENEEELETLRNMGVRNIQGFYFSQAKPAAFWDEILNRKIHPAGNTQTP